MSEGHYAITEPAANWGVLERFLELGTDLYAVRQVDVFANGRLLAYDRSHWVDEYGMLADGRVCRNDILGRAPKTKEISESDFQSMWLEAITSSTWKEQLGSELMSKYGLKPPWFDFRANRGMFAAGNRQ